MRKVLRKPYIFWFMGLFILYLGIDFILSGFYKTIPLIIFYSKTVNWLKLGLSIFLTVLTGFLVAYTTVLLYLKYRERKECKKAGMLTTIGAVSGFAVGVCPLCITGAFPLILSALGVTFSFASLPFQGIEIQILVVIILITSLFILNRKL